MPVRLCRLARRVALLLIVVAGASPAAWAVDCRHATRAPVSHAICQAPTLRKLDAQVSQLTERLLAKPSGSRAALRRDVANWQAETLWAGWRAISRHEAIVPALAPRYRSRLAYLEARLANSTPDSPAGRIVDALEQDARAASSASNNNGPNNLRARLAAAPGIDLAHDDARTTYAGPAAAFTALGLDATPALQAASHQALGDHALEMMWLADTGIGVLTPHRGKTGCIARQWFKAGPQGTAHRLEPPSIAAHPASPTGCTGVIALADINGRPTVLRIDRDNIDQDTIRTQTLADGRWTSPSTIRVRFDHKLGALEITHRKDAGTVFWRTLVMPTIQAFDRHPAPGFMSSALSPANVQKIKALRHRVEHGTAKVPLPRGDGPSPTAPRGEFDKSAIFFAQAARGHWLLGRIGHARVGNGWLVAYWTNGQNDQAVPLASIYAPRQRTALLGAAVLHEKAASSD